MKVLLATETFYHKNATSGDVLQMKRLDKGLKAIGVDSDIRFMVDEVIRCDKVDTCEGYCLNCANAEPKNFLNHLNSYAAMMENIGADIYHIRGPNLLREFTKHPISYVATYDIAKNPSAHKANLLRAKHLSALNDGVSELLTETFGLKFHTIHVPADIDLFNPTVKRHPIFDEIPSENIIGYSGGVQDHQGAWELISYFPSVLRLVRDAHIIMAINKWPNPNVEARFRAHINAMGLQKRIHITRMKQFEMPSFIKGCKVMHLARDLGAHDLREVPIVPIKALDYASMNKPVVFQKGDGGVEYIFNDERYAIDGTANGYVRGLVRGLLLDNEINTRADILRKGLDCDSVAKKAVEVWNVQA